MEGKYSLTETAGILGITSAWINRVQREANIGPKIGKKGHKVSFDNNMVETLRRIKVFRLLGFSFAEVKELYELEETILKAEQALAKEYALAHISTKKTPLLLHPVDITAIGPLFMHDMDTKMQNLLYKDKNIERYAKYLEQLHNAAKSATKRKEAFAKDIDDVTAVFSNVIEKFPRIS